MVFQQGANLSLVTQQDHHGGILTKKYFQTFEGPCAILPVDCWNSGK